MYETDCWKFECYNTNKREIIASVIGFKQELLARYIDLDLLNNFFTLLK
jgi:hypothetical protein